ncbi:MAG: hypothetical protein JRI52_10510 [Deltaproteobacteria bacterium]|nr:hypothetical protein [Deltaproteobacteria bacterium]
MITICAQNYLPNPFDLPLEYRARIIVEADNKISLDLQTRPLDAFYALNQITVSILLFIAFSQTFLIRCFDPDKYCIKSRLYHYLHERLVINKKDPATLNPLL